MINRSSYLMTSLVTIIFLSIFPIWLPVVHGVSAPEIFSTQSSPYGIPYSEWMIKWWQWHISLPTKGHPFVTHTLENCPVGNSGQVSFLTNSIQGESHYTCTIPAGHAILLRIASGECSTPELSANQRSDADYVKCATEGQNYLTHEVKVDGVTLNGLQDSSTSRFFNITIPADNVYNITAGTWKSIVSGYFAFLKPLPAGDHTVEIAAQVLNPTDQSFNFAYHTFFLLRVK